MKTIHFINLAATYITLGLYLFIFYGMIAQIILGPLQLLLATIISIRYYKILDQHNQILIMYYWFLAVVTLSIFGTTYFGKNDETSNIIWLFIAPMLVACYFLYVTKSLSRYLDRCEETTPTE